MPDEEVLAALGLGPALPLGWNKLPGGGGGGAAGPCPAGAAPHVNTRLTVHAGKTKSQITVVSAQPTVNEDI